MEIIEIIAKTREFEKLTIDELREMEEGQVIKQGRGFFPEIWRNGDLKWIAVRGGIADWAIYCDLVYYDYDYIRRLGDKMMDEKTIRKLIPCTDEVWETYRF